MRKIDKHIKQLRTMATAAEELADALNAYSNARGHSTGYDSGNEMADFRALALDLPEATKVMANAKRFLDEKLERSQRARRANAADQRRERA